MTAEDFVPLAGGLTVPRVPLDLLLDLERRNILCRQEGEMLRVSGPNGARPELSPAEVETIKKYKLHLLALVNYIAPERNR